MAEVYLVKGKTGEYADAVSWNVAGFIYEDDAALFAHELNKYCLENNVHKMKADHRKTNHPAKIIEKNFLDQNMQIDYTGTEYQVEGPFPLNLGGCILC